MLGWDGRMICNSGNDTPEKSSAGGSFVGVDAQTRRTSRFEKRANLSRSRRATDKLRVGLVGISADMSGSRHLRSGTLTLAQTTVALCAIKRPGSPLLKNCHAGEYR